MQHARPLQMSRRDSARANWEKSVATRWDHVANPSAHRSAPARAPRLSSEVRGIAPKELTEQTHASCHLGSPGPSPAKHGRE